MIKKQQQSADTFFLTTYINLGVADIVVYTLYFQLGFAYFLISENYLIFKRLDFFFYYIDFLLKRNGLGSLADDAGSVLVGLRFKDLYLFS